MKKKILLTILLAAFFACLLVFTVSAEQYGDLYYSIRNDEVAITGHTAGNIYYYKLRETGDIFIPSKIKGYPVTRICEDAFDRLKIGDVYIPSTVKIIEKGAFRRTNIKSIVIPDSVTRIEDSTFSHSIIDSIVLPDSIKEIGEGAFHTCKFSDSSMVLPKQLERIEATAFCDSNIKKIVIPDTVYYIGRLAFDGTLLTSVKIPKNITEIGTWCFHDCDFLETVEFDHDSMITEIIGYRYNDIDDVADIFDSCENLEKISNVQVFANLVNDTFNAGRFKNMQIVYYTDGSQNLVIKDDVSSYLKAGWYEDVNQTKCYMYAPGKEKIHIFISEVEKYKEQGWYTEPAYIMYTVDGKTTTAVKSKLDEYKEYGWYLEPVTLMYASDGRTTVAPVAEIDAYRNVGWYLEPVVLMYAANGRTQYVEMSKIDANKSVGWYLEPVTLMYAIDGRTTAVPKNKVDEYKKVGWYDNKSDITVTMYAADGRTIEVFKGKVEAYKKVGWYLEPVTLMYAIDGRTTAVPKNKVDEYKKVGWYDNKSDITVTMYAADGRTIEVFKGKVEEYKKVGWYSEPFVKMYTMDGRTAYVEKNKVEAYKKVGWYDNLDDVSTTIYDGKGQPFKIFKGELEDYLNNGYYESYDDTYTTVYNLLGESTSIYKDHIGKYTNDHDWSLKKPPIMVVNFSQSKLRFEKVYRDTYDVYCKLPDFLNLNQLKTIKCIKISPYTLKGLDGVVLYPFAHFVNTYYVKILPDSTGNVGEFRVARVNVDSVYQLYNMKFEYKIREVVYTDGSSNKNSYKHALEYNYWYD